MNDVMSAYMRCSLIIYATEQCFSIDTETIHLCISIIQSCSYICISIPIYSGNCLHIYPAICYTYMRI